MILFLFADIECPYRSLESADYIHNLAQHGVVQGSLYAQGGLETASRRTVSPNNRLTAIRILFPKPVSIRAIRTVNGNALGPGHKAEHVISINRIAASRHLIFQSLDTLGIDYKYIVTAAAVRLPALS